ncbi:MAG: exopolyphosphatase [Lachnospiraceae bacterium]|nr:exopolyphosphatase [Lachnospiraceae bacterium]
MKTFAALDVGSFELAMKIYEITNRDTLKEIDCVRHHLALGSDSYNTGKIGLSKIDELCRVLKEFRKIMDGYQVSEYKCYGTSAIRETANTMILLDQIKNRTGLTVEVLSNSEQRFLDYKSVAFEGEKFHRILDKGTAIVDIGGGNIQISLFENDTLVTTQSLKLGVLRIHEQLLKMQPSPSKVGLLIEEIADGQISVFKKLFMKDRAVQNLIIMDDYVSSVVKNGAAGEVKDGVMDGNVFHAFTDRLGSSGAEEMADVLSVPEENVPLIYISAKLIERLLLATGASSIWAPGVSLTDGIAYEYAEKKHIKMISHDFEKDILACARNISKRYMGSKKRGETLEEICLSIFDTMKKVHGMGKRQRFLLQLAAILHDCGKFINLTNVGECSYGIIMNTEIIGLSHAEREAVALMVRFNHDPFVYYEELAKNSLVDRETYRVVAKCTAILRVANGLDKSHKDKFKKLHTSLKDDVLYLSADADQDILYEMETFKERAGFFEEVFNIRPQIVQK